MAIGRHGKESVLLRDSNSPRGIRDSERRTSHGSEGKADLPVRNPSYLAALRGAKGQPNGGRTVFGAGLPTPPQPDRRSPASRGAGAVPRPHQKGDLSVQ